MRPQPSEREISYSFYQAFDGDAFHQFSLLDVDRFGREAKKRGVDLSFGATLRDRLQRLDEVGALRPVLFDVDGDTPVFREERQFVPWSRYAVEDESVGRPHPFYSYWQLLYVNEALELGRAPAHIDWLLKEDPARRLGEGSRPFYEAQREVWRELDQCWRPLVLLLTRIQNRYGPSIKGSLTKSSSRMVYDAEAGDYVDPYRRERAIFDAHAVLADLSLTLKDVKEMHQQVAIHGHAVDPNEPWYMLFRMAPFKERDSDPNRRPRPDGRPAKPLPAAILAARRAPKAASRRGDRLRSRPDAGRGRAPRKAIRRRDRLRYPLRG